MELLDIVTPVLMVVAAIAVVAAVYFAVTAVKDRRARKREEQLAARARANRPRRTDGRGDHMR